MNKKKNCFLRSYANNPDNIYNPPKKIRHFPRGYNAYPREKTSIPVNIFAKAR